MYILETKFNYQNYNNFDNFDSLCYQSCTHGEDVFVDLGKVSKKLERYGELLQSDWKLCALEMGNIRPWLKKNCSR